MQCTYDLGTHFLGICFSGPQWMVTPIAGPSGPTLCFSCIVTEDDFWVNKPAQTKMPASNSPSSPCEQYRVVQPMTHHMVQRNAGPVGKKFSFPATREPHRWGTLDFSLLLFLVNGWFWAAMALCCPVVSGGELPFVAEGGSLSVFT